MSVWPRARKQPSLPGFLASWKDGGPPCRAPDARLVVIYWGTAPACCCCVNDGLRLPGSKDVYVRRACMYVVKHISGRDAPRPARLPQRDARRERVREMIDLPASTHAFSRSSAVRERMNKTCGRNTYITITWVRWLSAPTVWERILSYLSLGNTNRASSHPLIRPSIHSRIHPFNSIQSRIQFSSDPSLGCYDDTMLPSSLPNRPLPKPNPRRS